MSTYRRSNPRRCLGLAATVLLLATACSTQRDVASSGGQQQPQDCRGAEKAQARVAKVWHRAQQTLGVPERTPKEVRYCQVDTTEYQTEPPYTIAFASQGPTNSWARTSDAYVRHKAQQLGVELLYASAGGDTAKQVGNIQDLLAQNPDALVVQPLGSSVKGQVSRAAREGVPVVVCTGILPGVPGVVSTVNRSYALQGSLWAQWIVKQLNGKGKIAMLSGIPGVPTAEYQYQAAKKVFAEHPGINIVTHKYTNWSPTKAKEITSTLLVQYPDLDAIWSDSAITDIGVTQAYTEAGKPVPPVTGDSSNGFLRLAKKHNVNFALSAYPPAQCGKAVEVAVNVLKGKRVPSRVPVQSAVYTDSQLDKYFRPDCTDSLWVPSRLPNDLLNELNLC